MAIFGASKLPLRAKSGSQKEFPKPADRYQTVVRDLLYRNADGKRRAFGITSSGSSEGVTTVAVNLANAAAYLSDSPVLLVDGNTTRPSIEQRFGLPESDGLREVVSGRQQLSECVRPTPIPKLAVLGPGASMRGSDVGEWTEALEAMTEHFSFVLVDMPPVSELGSQVVSTTGLDGVMLVVEAERSRRQAVLRAKAQLERMEVALLGVILNRRRNHVPAWLYQRI